MKIVALIVAVSALTALPALSSASGHSHLYWVHRREAAHRRWLLSHSHHKTHVWHIDPQNRGRALGHQANWNKKHKPNHKHK